MLGGEEPFPDSGSVDDSVDDSVVCLNSAVFDALFDKCLMRNGLWQGWLEMETVREMTRSATATAGASNSYSGDSGDPVEVDGESSISDLNAMDVDNSMGGRAQPVQPKQKQSQSHCESHRESSHRESSHREASESQFHSLPRPDPHSQSILRSFKL